LPPSKRLSTHCCSSTLHCNPNHSPASPSHSPYVPTLSDHYMTMASFDFSLMDPDTYFQQALMGMSMPDDSNFALTTCPPLCKCSLCTSLNRSSRSFATISSRSTESDEDVLSSHSSDRDDHVTVKRMQFTEGEPASIILPVSECSSPRSSPPSRPQTGKAVDDDEIRSLEREVKRLRARDRELESQRSCLEIERDNLKQALTEVESPTGTDGGMAIGSPNSTKLEQIREPEEE
jgi:hypothetical protein